LNNSTKLSAHKKRKNLVSILVRIGNVQLKYGQQLLCVICVVKGLGLLIRGLLIMLNRLLMVIRVSLGQLMLRVIVNGAINRCKNLVAKSGWVLVQKSGQNLVEKSGTKFSAKSGAI
jgi:hypothetical protein